MWNKERSVLLTQFIVKVCYVLLALSVIAVALPLIIKNNDMLKELAQVNKYIIIPFYLIVPAGYTALVCIDKLLTNIKKELVFDGANVRLLRIISWSCFYVAGVSLISFIIICSICKMIESAGLLLLCAGAVFMGLVVRVVKNIFESAIEIKEENDMTILGECDDSS